MVIASHSKVSVARSLAEKKANNTEKEPAVHQTTTRSAHKTSQIDVYHIAGYF